jgi:membrane-associated phospholipid phosphatase
MSNIFLNITVSSLKSITMRLRPDSSDYLSFPSGHTAEAFANAEFLRLEYRHKSIWYGIAGYVVAGFTGYLRMYNNKHYLSEVLAGAGIGILSTDLSYWLYPKVKGMFVKHGVKNAMVLPFYQRSVAGLSLSYQLP